MTKQEHLNWCKKRALELVDAGELTQAFASMGSDLNKHPETEGHIGIKLGIIEVMGGHLDTVDKMRDFINGFN